MDYIGKVIYNEDPTFTGRCKVRVFGLFDALEDENIPWFMPVTSEIFSSGGAGSVSIPKINDIVRVRFSNNDYYSGEYLSVVGLDPRLVEEIKEDYLGTHVLLYDADEELLVIYQRMTGIKIFHKGSYMVFDPHGDIQIQHQNLSNVVEIKEDGIIIATNSSKGGGGNSTGYIHLSSGDKIDITAPTVKVNADKVLLGNGAGENNYSAVKGEELQTVLKTIVAELAAKQPQGSSLVNSNFSQILSKTTKVAQ